MRTDEYTTKNLNLASFLSCIGSIKFTGSTKVKGEIFFHFTPKEVAEQHVDEYFSDIAIVNPKQLFAKLHDLKDLIFNQREYQL